MWRSLGCKAHRCRCRRWFCRVLVQQQGGYILYRSLISNRPAKNLSTRNTHQVCYVAPENRLLQVLPENRCSCSPLKAVLNCCNLAPTSSLLPNSACALPSTGCKLAESFGCRQRSCAGTVSLRNPRCSSDNMSSDLQNRHNICRQLIRKTAPLVGWNWSDCMAMLVQQSRGMIVKTGDCDCAQTAASIVRSKSSANCSEGLIAQVA